MAVTAMRNPKVTLNMIPRDQIVGLEEHRCLLVGQKTSSGTATAGLVRDVPNTNAEINALFGARSMLAMMARAFRAVNPYTALDCIALADSGTTKATAVIASSGTATEARTIYVDVVSSQNHSYKIDCIVGETPATFTAKLQALTALDTSAPFTDAKSTASVTDDTVTFTAANSGTHANNWLIRIRDAFGNPGAVAGLTFTLTGWTGGATDPTLTSVLDPTENIRYHGVVWPSTYATTVVKSWINARFNLDNDIKDGVVFQYVHDTFSNVKTAALAMNSPSFVMLTNETMNTAYWKGSHLPEAPNVIAARFMAARARRFEEDISVSDLVVNNEPLDQFGGRHMASLPYFNTPLVDVGQPERGAGYTYAEQLDLESKGVSVIGANIQNNAVIAGVIVTTYQNDAAGNADDTWKWLEWRDTHSVIREFFVNNLREDFSQHRLTSGSTVSGYAIANEALIRATCGEYYAILADDVLTVAGRDARKYFDENLVVTVVPEERKVVLNADVPMVSQLGSIIGTIKFNFNA